MFYFQTRGGGAGSSSRKENLGDRGSRVEYTFLSRFAVSTKVDGRLSTLRAPRPSVGVPETSVQPMAGQCRNIPVIQMGQPRRPNGKWFEKTGLAAQECSAPRHRGGANRHSSRWSACPPQVVSCNNQCIHIDVNDKHSTAPHPDVSTGRCGSTGPSCLSFTTLPPEA
eukprot:scaffold29889_cov63-Phaeocystis_antarctica.AAC.1